MAVANDGIGQVASAAHAVGLRGDALITAIAIAGAESGYRLDAHGDVSLGGSYGPWQVYVPAHPQYTPEWLTASYMNNATAMYEISGGGANWNPWTTYWNGAYVGHLEEAAVAAAAIGDGSGIDTVATVASRSDGLSEPFGSRLDSLLAAFGGRVWVTSGKRSYDEQSALWEASDKSGVMVGSPDGSKHVKGMAADLGWDSDATISEVHAVAADYGLWFPMSYENWHIEPIGSRDGTYVEANTDGAVSSIKKGWNPGDIADKLNPLDDIGSLIGKVFTFPNMFRVGQFLAGAILAMFGLYALLKKPLIANISQVASAAEVLPL